MKITTVLSIVLVTTYLRAEMKKAHSQSLFLCLLVLIAVKMLAMPILCLHYALNKKLIAARLCVNIDKPQLHCEGKCHLTKQMNSSGDTGQTGSEKRGYSFPASESLADNYSFELAVPQMIEPPINIANENMLINGYSSGVFHPPTLLV